MATNDEVAAAAEGHGLRCEGVENQGDGGSHLSCARESADRSLANGNGVSVTYNVISADDEWAHATVAAYGTPPPADWLDVATSVALLFCEEHPEAVRQAVESTAPQTELSGCRVQASPDDFAPSIDISPAPPSAEPPGAPATWSTEGTSTYGGTWTLTAYGIDTEFGEPEYGLGDSVPGTITLDCATSDDHCGFITTRDGEQWWVVGLEVIAEGRLRYVDESELENCDDGQTVRTTHEVTYGPEDATASIAVVNLPRTCTYEDGTLYSTDTTWSFEGVLTEHVPPAADDLAGFLASYGLTCADENAATTCTLEVNDDEGLDATYVVTTRLDDAGGVIGVDAVVTSLDESMPSDAIGFLRGIAERAPVDDGDGLLAWFDAAISGSGTPYEAGLWTATWADAAEGAGRTLSLAVAQAGAGPSAPPSEAAAPGSSTSPSAAPAAPAEENLAGPRPFAASVPEPAEISTDPIVVLQSAALAALLVFLMPFPSQLFNSTLETHEDEVRRWLRLDRIGSAVAGIGAFWASWPGVIAFTLLAAVLYGFLDPGFGLDIGSLATFLGMLVGIVLVTAAFAVPVVLAHRRIGDPWSLKVVPVSLLIGVACVVLSRLTGFQPGYLYGLLIGLAFARELSAADEGRATAIGAALMLAVAFGAWLGLGALPDGEGFGLTVLRTSLAALMVAGLEGVVFGLLPMRFLPGEPLYAWNRILWGGLLLVGAFAFFHILINPASGYLSDSSRTPLFTVVGLLLGFSFVSVAFWAWFRFRPESEEVVGASQ